MVNIAFTLTPMSAPGSAARLALFRLAGTHFCCSTWGFGFHPSLSTRVCAIAAVYFKAISPMTQFHRFLVSLHMHDNPTFSFRISPCPLCSLLRISGLRHSSEVDSLSVLGFFRRLLRHLIIIRPDTPIFLTGEQLACFSGPFVPCIFFLGSPDSLFHLPLAFCFQMLMRWQWSQPDKQRKLFREEKARFPMTSLTSFVSFFPQGNLY